MSNALKKFRHLFDPIDLTKGSIVRGLLLFMIPILLSNVFQQLYTLTDAVIVGQNLGTFEIAGINDVGPLSSFALQFCIGCTTGFSVVISHKVGENNFRDVRKSFYLQLWLCLVMTVLLTVAFCFSTDSLLALMKITPSETDPNQQALYQAAHDYLFIIYLGIVANMGYNFIFSNLRALGDSFMPFVFLGLGVLINVGLDILFIVPLHMGVIGSALATVLSELIATIACFIYALMKYKDLRYEKGDLRVSGRFVWNHLKLGLPLGLQFSVLEIGIIVMQMGIIAFDYTAAGLLVDHTPAQVGYSVACKVNLIIMTVYQAVGMALMTFVGQNYGAGEMKRIRKGFLTGLILGSVFFVILSAIGLLITIDGAYQYIFLSKANISRESIDYGNWYLYLCIPCDSILLILFIARHTLQGLNRPLPPFFAGVGELAARLLICLFLPQIVNGGPINSSASPASYLAVCLADPLAWVAAIVIMLPPLIKAIFFGKDEITPDGK